MRFVVYGAGAIGGVVGGRLAAARARGGAHRARRPPRRHPRRRPAPRRRPTPRPVDALDPGRVAPRGHRLPRRRRRAPRDEEPAHRQGARARSPPPRPRRSSVVCVQNGVANEPAALRLFDDVYGVCVVLPGAAPRAGRGRGATRRRSPASSTSVASRTASTTARRDDRGRVRVVDVRVGRRAPTSCGGSTASSSTTSATRSTRCAVPTPTARVVHRRAWDEGAAVPRGRRHRRGQPRGGRRPPGRRLPVGWRRRPRRGRARRRGRAWPGARARSRPTTSTARSCCWAGSTACPPRSTCCCSSWPRGAAREGRRPGSAAASTN